MGDEEGNTGKDAGFQILLRKMYYASKTTDVLIAIRYCMLSTGIIKMVIDPIIKNQIAKHYVQTVMQ